MSKLPALLAGCGWIALMLGVLTGAFSDYAIITHLLVALALSLIAWAPATAPGRFFGLPAVRAAFVVYLALAAIADWALSRSVITQAMPVLYLVDWLFRAPKAALPFRYAVIWLCYPLTYLSYLLVRGAIDGFAPYAPLNATNLGSANALSNAAMVLVGCVLLGAGVIRVSRWVAPRQSAQAACCD